MPEKIPAEPEIRNAEHIRCLACDLELEVMKVTMTYLKSTFPTRILRCPGCGQSFIPAELALGKTAEVERVLEEK